MNNNLKATFRQQYDKIIDAYFKDEIKPMEAGFCFCGTLCNGKIGWHNDSYTKKHNDFGDYSGIHYVMMERALLDKMKVQLDGTACCYTDTYQYEDRLFAGMSAALEVLKQIHIERGEVIDETPVFEKRTLGTYPIQITI